MNEVYDYLDAISALKSCTKLEEMTISEVSNFLYGWLTAKGSPCDFNIIKRKVLEDWDKIHSTK